MGWDVGLLGLVGRRGICGFQTNPTTDAPPPLKLNLTDHTQPTKPESKQVEHFSKDVERQIKTTELEKRKRDAAAYVDPAKGAEAKDRGNEHFRAGKWPDAIKVGTG